MNKEWLRNARKWFFLQKYRFDLSISFLVFFNFALLILAVSDKLKIILGLERISEVALLLIPAGFVCAWAVGWFLERVVKAQAQAEQQSFERSFIWRKNFDELEELKRELRELKALWKKQRKRRMR